MDDLWRNVTITYECREHCPHTLYANVSPGQYEILAGREEHIKQVAPKKVVMSVWAQLTLTGDISPRVVHLDWVTKVDDWEPRPDSVARDFPARL